jgi:4a-hydroxytetrahydrobiopterin dehydratase
MARRLEGAERQQALRKLTGWIDVVDADAIRRVFHFSSFREAWGFLNEVARLAEKMDHYPEILSAQERVEIRLTTPAADDSEVGALTDRDVALAHAIDKLAPERDSAREPTRPSAGLEAV